MTTKPSIVFVHGAWGDGSHWRHVIPPLYAKGYRICATQNPLTSLADDIDRTSKLAAAQGGPILLVGHSYGGAVITDAGHIWVHRFMLSEPHDLVLLCYFHRVIITSSAY